MSNAGKRGSSSLTAKSARKQRGSSGDSILSLLPELLSLPQNKYTLFDQLIVDNFQTSDPLPKAKAPLLLSTIVTCASDRPNQKVNQKYTSTAEAKKAITKKPELFGLLESAWKKKSFGSILALPVLQGSQYPSSASSWLPERVERHDLIYSVWDAWDTKYIGDHHHILLNNISRMLRENPLSHSVTIIQSSGTGKSRMMLGHIFRAVADELETLYKDKVPTYGALARNWRNHMERGQNRTRLYGQAVKRCTIADLSTPETIAKEIPISRGLDSEPSCQSTEDKPLRVKLMLYFDEAHVLKQKVPQDRYNEDIYDALRSCFKNFTDLPIFTIYLSTSPLGRARPNLESLHDPVTETPFDCSPKFPIRSGTLKLEDVSKIKFMAHFGRPLFWSLLAGAGHDQDDILWRILHIARGKLTHGYNIQSISPVLPRVVTYVVLDVALCLDFEPRSLEARRLEADLLLATCASPFRPRGTVNISALVIRQSLCWRRPRLGSAVREDHPNDSSPMFSRGCKLTSFIEALFSECNARKVLDSVPDNIQNSTTFASMFEDAIVRFTHFGKTADDTGTTSYAMFAAFIRGMAIICGSPHEAIDILIPVLLKPKKMLEESVMSGLLIQLRQPSRRAGHNVIDQNSLNFFPIHREGKEEARPYITLIAQLGVLRPVPPQGDTEATEQQSIAASGPNPLVNVPPTEPSSSFPTPTSKCHTVPRPESIAHPLRDVHPRYSIFAYGCSDEVYSGIGMGKWSISSMLERGFLGEHPRRDPDSLLAVENLKPVWSAGLGSYRWIEEPFLQVDRDLSKIGWLTVGKYDPDSSAVSHTLENFSDADVNKVTRI
ncbi:hypothetical protein BS47DRAFT_1383937 [Hydnum rufescens UP504]|uniref:Uncharacterized protein n=1 Tax=Hydnum rufescens UP504 TaxID=1448309 RepID=A0A9P6DTG5_9AGAM|nr:hypothetical protein BS47DRAFT_1383937 [Hydnum rufescens UP504]